MFPIISSSPSFPFPFPLELFSDTHVHSRKLLLHTPLFKSPNTASPPGLAQTHDSEFNTHEESSFDANAVMVLSVLLCALICALGINSIIRCALRCSSQLGFESNNSSSNRLANTGVKRKALKTFPIITYSAGSKLPGLDTECVICLSEFSPGEQIRVLPKCNHGFHIRCIDKWLMSHSSCPTCRHCLINTCEKIVNCSEASTSEPSSSLQVAIVPLEPEGLIRNYRGICQL